MMGGGRKDKKFVNKIMRQLQNDEILAVNDKDGTPTYTYDFVRNVMFLLNSEKWGVYNMVCEGEASRYDVAAEIIRLTESKASLTAVNSYHFRDEYFVPRPASERLVCTKLRIRGLYFMRDWKVCLNEYINQMK
jgi:dTDP-4-dehydrorhamnose reductase